MKDLEALVRTCSGWALGATLLILLAGVIALLVWRKRAGGGIRHILLAPAPALLPRPVPPPRWYLPVLGMVVLGALALRLPRMTLSLYNDECHNYVRLIAGEWRNYGEPTAKFRQPKWLETGFRNTSGNNGFMFSLLARASLDTWHAATNKPDGVVCEWPVRLPSLLGGLMTIGVVAAVGCRLGAPTAGIAAAVLLAIHPWHVRYSTEARGYALMMLAMAASHLMFLRACQSGKWRDWLGHGIIQFLALWANLGALFAVALGQAGVAGYLLWQWRKNRAPGALSHMARWSAGGVIAALLTALLLLPGILQLQQTLHTNPSLLGSIPSGWWLDTLSFLAHGCGWATNADGNPINPTTAGHALRVAGFVAAWLLLGSGVLAAVRQRQLRVPLLLAGLQIFALVPLYLRSAISGNVLLWWYALPALPGLVLITGFTFADASRSYRAAGLAVAAIFALSVASILPPVLQHSKCDGRSLVRMARGGDFPAYNHQPLTFGLWSDAVTYDPLVRPVESVAQLQAAGRRSDATGVPMFVYVGHAGSAATTHQEVLAYLKSSDFVLQHTAWGLESPTNNQLLYRWKN